MKVDSLNGPVAKSRFEDDDTEDFEIAPEAYGLVMKYLTEIYDDPTLAAVRETISNAFDAHQAVGSSEKVQITVSSTDDQTPYFEVTDFGVGMSKHSLKKVYTKYGISTKRDDEDAIGGFGLGCKSPLAIEDRFFVESTKDGVTVVVENYTGNDGKFKQDLVDEYDSDKPNGTTVRINLENTSVYTVREKVQQFLKFVDPEKYVLKTTSPTDDFSASYALSNTDKYHKITETDEFTVYADMSPHYYTRPIIVMGDVAYNFSVPTSIESNTSLNPDALKVIIIAPINSVTITTSRENTQDTKKTRSFLEKVYLQYQKDVEEYFQKYIDEAETPMEVYSRLRDANAMVRQDYTYKGEEILARYNFDNHNTEFVSKKYGSAPYKSYRDNVVTSGNTATFMVLPDDTPDTKEGAITRAYNSFLRSMDLETGHFYFLDEEEKVDSWWIKENPHFHFIKKGDILTKAAEYRKEQRKANGNDARPRRTGKVKYTIIYNELDTPVDDNFLMEIEYPEIPAGIPYITMKDVVVYGLCRNTSETVFALRHSLKRLLDFFEFEGPLLILENGKKEDTMVKRTHAKKLELDFLSVESKLEECENYALSRLAQKTHFVDQIRAAIGEENFALLKDPRFVTSVPSVEVESTLDTTEYNRIRSMVSNMFSYDYNEYYYKNSDKIYDLKVKFQKLGSYYWESEATRELYKDVNNLESDYMSIISFDYHNTAPALTVQILNTIYEDYLTK